MGAVVFEVGGRMWLLLLWSSWMHIGFVDTVLVYHELNGEHLLGVKK